MPRDRRIDDEPRNLDVFEDLTDDKDDGDIRSDPLPAGSVDAEVQRARDVLTEAEELQPTVAADADLPDVEIRSAGEGDDDLFNDDDGLELDGVDELQASEPEPTLNLPDAAADDGDDLDYAGPDETLTFGNPDDELELEYSGPELELNLSDEEDGEDEGDEEPAPSVPQDESTEPIIFDEEANQGHPVDPGDDEEPGSDDLAEPVIPVPSDPVDDYPDFTQTPDLPLIEAFPEPPYELEFDPNPPYDLTIDDSDDGDDGMGGG